MQDSRRLCLNWRKRVYMKFDLHIHSIASEYKESDGIVDDSTIENAELLLRKLDENEVGLFSITDHNRFNIELYNKLDSEIKSGKYDNVKGIVAGVEFDVQIDSDMGKCHIITIFDARNEVDNYKKIKKAIDKKILNNKEAYYKRGEFESILKEIGLDVILIACQRNSLDKHDGKHNSLSESTKDSERLIMTGYINALEFQRPNVEGILKNNLRDIPINLGLVMGSDCHDWNVYPNHDKKNGNDQFTHSRAKILPTFKGLLMAITSPETRINQQESSNVNYIEKFSIGEIEIPLVNGINAIIGENGSGKSTLLKLLCNKATSPKYIKNLVENNKLYCENRYSSEKLFIGQGDIIKKFDDCTLFPKENFIEVDHSNFKNLYTSYANSIMMHIKNNIAREDAIEGLSKKILEYNELNNSSTYFLQVECDQEFVEIDNIHEKHKKCLFDIINKLEHLLKEDYFDKYKRKLEEVIIILNSIFDEITQNYNIVDSEKIVKNIIASELHTYNLKISEAATSKEKDQIAFNKKRGEFIKSIISAIQKNVAENTFPDKPNNVTGFSKKPSCGFNFNSEANYHERDVHNDFLTLMFNQKYASIDKLQNIKKSEMLVDAIRGCTSFDQIEAVYKSNLDKFLIQMCECKNYIIDVSNGEKTLGSTLGEQSLAYFKYITEYETDKSIFLVDQPEDHISNNNISKRLIKYLNSIRKRKQIIIVTHNPLLVVNQDVEQVIFVKKNNNKINIVSGCLELENKDVNMLELIADNMDGGKAAIEKRLRVYG